MPVTIGGSGPITGVTSINTTVTDTELGYLDGVTSALQTQINAKAADSSQGLYLITPTSIANSGGSASASGGAVTFTTVNSVSLNGAFTSTYAAYRIVISFSGSTGLALNARLRASGSDATGSNYDRQALSAFGASVAASQNNATNVAGFGQGGTARTSLTVIDIYNPQVAANTAYLGTCVLPGSNIQTDVIAGFHTLSTSYDGFSLIASTGTVTGTVRVYGYKNS